MTTKIAKAKVVAFEGIGTCFYKHNGFRPPRKGEFYLSGAIVMAYRAPNDLSSAYNIVIPTRHAIATAAWALGDEVEP